MVVRKFLRSDTRRHLRLGKNRRNLQKWRRPRGRHSKIRKKRAGYPASPSIGYRSPQISSGLIKGKVPVMINSASDMKNVAKGSLVILSRRFSARTRMELVKIASEKDVHIHNSRSKQ